MFDNPDDFNKHKEPSLVSVPSLRKPLSSHVCMSPEPCKDPMANPVKRADTPLGPKRARRVSSLSLITPQNNTDKICNRGRDRPKAKLVGRFTRSMAKSNVVKTPMADSVQVETVVLDDEESDLPLPVNDNIVQLEFISNPID